MVHVHTAALLALAHVFRSALECASQVHEKDNQKEDVEEDASDHGSAPVAIDEHVDRHAHEYSHTNSNDENEGEFEHSGLCLLLGALGLDQLGPDAGERFLAQHLPRQLALGFILCPTRPLRVHVAPTGEALVQVLFIDARQHGEALAVVRGQLVCHARHLSESLGDVKLFARDAC